MMKRSVISNSTPLIAFIKKNELHVLKSLFNELLIPKAVSDEILNLPQKLDNEGEIFNKEIKKKWIIIKEISSPKFTKLNLGKGETEALNLCFEVDNPLLLMDESKGRNIAKAFEIEVLGTLGILALAKKKNIKNEQDLMENLNLLIKRGFYLSSNVILLFFKELKK